MKRYKMDIRIFVVLTKNLMNDEKIVGEYFHKGLSYNRRGVALQFENAVRMILNTISNEIFSKYYEELQLNSAATKKKNLGCLEPPEITKN